MVFTTRWQAGASPSVLARTPLAGVGIQHAAQLQFGQAHHFCKAAALVLEGQLVVVQDDRIQAALEAAQHLGGPLVGQAPDVVHLHLRTKVHGAVGAERLEVQGGLAPLHVAVVEREAGEVPIQLQENRVPASVVHGPAGNAQDARASATVQLEPQLAIYDLQKESKRSDSPRRTSLAIVPHAHQAGKVGPGQGTP